MPLVPPCTRGPNGTPCGFVAPGPLVPGQCPECWINSKTAAEHAALAAADRASRASESPPARGTCLHLGPQLSAFDRPACRRTYRCERGHGEVCPGRECQSCPDFQTDDPTRP